MVRLNDAKQSLLLNPESWTPKQLEEWLQHFENGRYARFVGPLKGRRGAEVLRFTTANWAQLTPPELATSLRFTLLGMVQVASNDDTLAIVTDFVPLAHSPAKFKRISQDKIMPVKFPPMVEVPSVPILILSTLFVILTILCFTVLRGPLADIGIDSESLVKYGSIPLVSVVFTYLHIWVALWMTFYPLKYAGCLQIPNTNTGLGWQGIVPNKGEKMARQAVQMMTKRLLHVSEIFARIEPSQVVRELEPILFSTIHTVVEDMALKYSPELWAVLPIKVKEEIIEKVKEESPAHIEALMDEIRNNIEDVFDLEDMVVTSMCKDKQLLVNMFITCGYSELAFIRNSGAYMGGIFGLIQMGIWFVYSDRIVVFPVIGLLVGTITNWLALKMIFEPVNPKKYCGITFHGLFLRRQNEVAEVYGKMVARDVLNSRNIFEAILKGPYSDRLFELVYDNVQEAVNAATQTTQKLINFSIGEEVYANIKDDVTNHIVEIFPESLRQIESYATVAMDLEVTLREKMKLLSSEQFENLLHPIFEEDEWKLVVMGGVLGVVIGLVQVFLINH
ncbi:Protein of unknown function DUF445, transmembrane [Plasmopara halstedii]|uniref:DUF445 domain-containing protein n=1 Tax=Plasmopara halstedii TaxID=4781 RepID=A0A0P1AU79_PLAHL|nr:Protein of unknown function DUF445, transmembrane [Plasmopara halstedii]CEG44862.1 Protein of unknown function DUF445, transmembrane [Plasmopara halstedii]|eukprot:XP_024581231.1 Protein of unknown function DUF445, transmembrane [Plasmopara halstedii]